VKLVPPKMSLIIHFFRNEKLVSQWIYKYPVLIRSQWWKRRGLISAQCKSKKNKIKILIFQYWLKKSRCSLRSSLDLQPDIPDFIKSRNIKSNSEKQKGSKTIK
jgi:hypothetical protein